MPIRTEKKRNCHKQILSIDLCVVTLAGSAITNLGVASEVRRIHDTNSSVFVRRRASPAALLRSPNGGGGRRRWNGDHPLFRKSASPASRSGKTAKSVSILTLFNVFLTGGWSPVTTSLPFRAATSLCTRTMPLIPMLDM